MVFYLFVFQKAATIEGYYSSVGGGDYAPRRPPLPIGAESYDRYTLPNKYSQLKHTQTYCTETVIFLAMYKKLSIKLYSILASMYSFNLLDTLDKLR